MKVEKNIKESIRLKRRKPTTLKEDDGNGMRKFEMVFTVDGVKSQQKVSAINIQKAEELIKKQYEGKQIVFTSKKEVNESLDEDLNTPTSELDSGLANLLINAINDEWSTIASYNDLVSVLSKEQRHDMINVVEDIINEENTHVGQLQALLKSISPNVENISGGEAEASNQMSEQTVDDDFGENSGFGLYF